MSAYKKKNIRLSIDMSVEVPFDWNDDQCEFFLVDNHCTGNHFEAIGKRLAAELGVCNTCRFAKVEMLPDGVETYDPGPRQ